MFTRDQVTFEFGNFRLLSSDKRLLRAGKPLTLKPKVFETLLILVESQGHLVEKEDFIKRLWPDSFVEESALAQNISQLRKLLGNGTVEGTSSFIETVPKRGYRFLAPVKVTSNDSEKVRHFKLAVLPFENLGAGREHEYLADGLTEELIAALGQIDPGYLSVIGRTSVMPYKKATKSLAEIGRELGAEFLVESAIRAEGDRIRVTSKLIRSRDQVQVWSASYDREPASVLEFQRELSRAIAQELRVRISPSRFTAMARRQTQQLEAYDLYLRGRFFWNQLSPATTRRAIEYFSRATEHDPEYALAWSGLADAYTASPINGDAPPLQVWQRANEAAMRAVRSGPDLAETQTSVGLVNFWLGWEWDAAEEAFNRAIAMDSSYALSHRNLGILLSHSGRHGEARAAVRRARELDPLHAAHVALSAQVEFNARDYEAAIQYARQATLLDPEFPIGYIQLAQAHLQLGNSELALDALNTAGRFSTNCKLIALRGSLFAKLGRVQEAQAVLKMLEAASGERYVPPYAIALVNATLEERDSAFKWLDRAYEVRDVHLIFLPVDPKWDTFRADARFHALLKKCGFPYLRLETAVAVRGQSSMNFFPQ
jgi:TolB-like protein/Tfp pilus assembly protein PilF